ncbi:MAG: hypothetical protein WCK32_07980 [Chlorobiaceae bacterium]
MFSAGIFFGAKASSFLCITNEIFYAYIFFGIKPQEKVVPIGPFKKKFQGHNLISMGKFPEALLLEKYQSNMN